MQMNWYISIGFVFSRGPPRFLWYKALRRIRDSSYLGDPGGPGELYSGICPVPSIQLHPPPKEKEGQVVPTVSFAVDSQHMPDTRSHDESQTSSRELLGSCGDAGSVSSPARSWNKSSTGTLPSVAISINPSSADAKSSPGSTSSTTAICRRNRLRRFVAI